MEEKGEENDWRSTATSLRGVLNHFEWHINRGSPALASNSTSSTSRAATASAQSNSTSSTSRAALAPAQSNSTSSTSEANNSVCTEFNRLFAYQPDLSQRGL